MSINQIVSLMMTISANAARVPDGQELDKIEADMRNNLEKIRKTTYVPPDDMDNMLIQQYHQKNQKKKFWQEFKETATYVIPGFMCYFLALYCLLQTQKYYSNNIILVLGYVFLSSIFGTLTYTIAVQAAKRK